MSSAPHPPHVNGNFHVPKWVLPLAVTYVLAQGGTSIFGTVKQATAVDTVAKNAEVSVVALDALTKEVREHNTKQDAAMQWMHQQLLVLNGRVSAIEKGKKPDE